MTEQQKPSKATLFSATLLVAGTIIGGGMLALPLATGISGFWPSTVFMLICWLAMTLTALLYLEVTLWLPEGAHVISMTEKILGPFGRWVAWILYLFISYSSLIAYAAGGGLLIASFSKGYFGIEMTQDLGAIIFSLLFGITFYFGNIFVGRINSFLFMGMLGAYFLLIGVGLPEVKGALLSYRDWTPAIFAIPIFLTSFSFQTMVPSLPPFLARNKKALQMAICGGTTLALGLYILWQTLILGIIPVEGESGLREALLKGESATQFLNQHVEASIVSTIAEYFAFFAIITSFLGIGLGLFDFLSDGLKIKEKGFGKVILSLLIIVPTLFFSSKFERIFYIALDATGGYGDAILNGMIPVLLVLVGRYSLGLGEGKPGILERKPLLYLLFLFYLFVLLFKIAVDLGVVMSPG